MSKGFVMRCSRANSNSRAIQAGRAQCRYESSSSNSESVYCFDHGVDRSMRRESQSPLGLLLLLSFHPSSGFRQGTRPRRGGLVLFERTMSGVESDAVHPP